MNRPLLLALALLGLGASATSSYVHYQLLTDPTYTSFCDVSATVSCTQAYLSPYGSFLGVPVAILGVCFFTLVLLMVALAPRPRVVPAGRKMRAAEAAGVSGENVPAYVLALSTAALAFSLYLAWASFFQLRTLCVLCAITYVAVAGLFIVALGATSVPFASIPRRAVRDASALAKSPTALAVAILLLGGASLAFVLFPHKTGEEPQGDEGSAQYVPLTDGQRLQFEQWYNMQPVLDLPIDKGTAKVLVVKFNDYQCPPCRQTYNDYKGILSKYSATGDVKFVLKHFPLEFECNTQNAGHMAACEAAAAVLMAQKNGTAGKLESWLFANQGPPLLTPDQVRRAAAAVAGVNDFDAQYATVLNEVKADAALGSRLGARSTPTFFINGRRIAGALSAAAFEAAIRMELKK
jgi:protein-disulfide isomerase